MVRIMITVYGATGSGKSIAIADMIEGLSKHFDLKNAEDIKVKHEIDQEYCHFEAELTWPDLK